MGAFIAGVIAAYAVPLCVWLLFDIVRTQKGKREVAHWLQARPMGRCVVCGKTVEPRYDGTLQHINGADYQACPGRGGIVYLDPDDDPDTMHTPEPARAMYRRVRIEKAVSHKGVADD